MVYIVWHIFPGMLCPGVFCPVYIVQNILCRIRFVQYILSRYILSAISYSGIFVQVYFVRYILFRPILSRYILFGIFCSCIFYPGICCKTNFDLVYIVRFRDLRMDGRTNERIQIYKSRSPHFCASSHLVRYINILNLYLQKSRSKSRSTIFAKSLFDSKCQNIQKILIFC